MAITSLFGSDWDLSDWNSTDTPVTSYNFVIVVEGIYDVPIKSIHSFKKENEFEMIQEGGMNDYVHMRRKPISRPFQFQIERYLGTDKFDLLSLGTEFILPLILCVSRWRNPSEANSSRFYIFLGATVIEKEYGTLDAEKSGLATETITIAYKELYAMNQNFINTDGDTITNSSGEEVEAGSIWKFNKEVVNRAGVAAKKAREGNGKIHARMNPGKSVSSDGTVTFGFGKDYKETSQEDMAKKAKLWAFDKTAESRAGISTAAAKAGTGDASAEPPYIATTTTDSTTGKSSTTYGHGTGFTEPSQSDFEKKARLWKYNTTSSVVSRAGRSSEAAKKGSGTKSAPPSAGSDGKTPPTYGYGSGYTEELWPVWEGRAKKATWGFNTTAASKAGLSTEAAKNGLGKRSSAAAYAHMGSKTEKDEKGKEKTSYGNGQDYKEALQSDYEGKAKLWKFKKGVVSKAGLSSPDAKKGDGEKAPTIPTTGSDGKTPATYGSGTGYNEELRSVWEDRAHLWPKYNSAKKKLDKTGVSNTEKKSNLWKFDHLDAKGNGVTHDQSNLVPDKYKKTKSDMEKAANDKMWAFQGKAKEGNGQTHNYDAMIPTELKKSKEDLEKAANDKMWAFDKKSKEGNKKRHVPGKEPDENKVTKEDREKKASMWSFDGKSKEGNKKRHITGQELDPNNVSKETMEGKAKLWPKDQSAVYHKGGQKAEERLWPKQSSAVYHTGGQDPQGRKWPQTASAKKVEGGKPAEERLWPKQKSAVYPKKGKDPQPRLYPEVRSAVYRNEGKDPQPRRWPEMKSAVYITDILS